MCGIKYAIPVSNESCNKQIIVIIKYLKYGLSFFTCSLDESFNFLLTVKQDRKSNNLRRSSLCKFNEL